MYRMLNDFSTVVVGDFDWGRFFAGECAQDLSCASVCVACRGVEGRCKATYLSSRFQGRARNPSSFSRGLGLLSLHDLS
jgi:hypothetical protein